MMYIINSQQSMENQGVDADPSSTSQIVLVVREFVGATGDDGGANVGEAASDWLCCVCCDLPCGVGRHMIFAERLKSVLGNLTSDFGKIAIDLTNNNNDVYTAIADCKKPILREFIIEVAEVYEKIYGTWLYKAFGLKYIAKADGKLGDYLDKRFAVTRANVLRGKGSCCGCKYACVHCCRCDSCCDEKQCCCCNWQKSCGEDKCLACCRCSNDANCLRCIDLITLSGDYQKYEQRVGEELKDLAEWRNVLALDRPVDVKDNYIGPRELFSGVSELRSFIQTINSDSLRTFLYQTFPEGSVIKGMEDAKAEKNAADIDRKQNPQAEIKSRLTGKESELTTYERIRRELDDKTKNVDCADIYLNVIRCANQSYNISPDEFIPSYMRQGGHVWENDRFKIARVLWQLWSAKFNAAQEQRTLLNDKVRATRRCFSGNLFCCVILLILIAALVILVFVALSDIGVHI